MKVIIFDFDNTLEDFATVKRQVEKKIAKYVHKKHGINPKYFIEEFEYIDLLISHRGASKKPFLFDRKYWFMEFFKLAGMNVKQKEINELVDMYWKHINTKAKLLPNVRSTLKYLKEKYKIVVMSDSDGKRKIKMDRIKNVKINDLIDFVVLGDDIKLNKPHKKYYDFICKRLKVKPSDCAMMGDKPEVDLELAKKLGMKTVWFKHGAWSEALKGKKFKYVDHEIKDFSKLKEIL